MALLVADVQSLQILLRDLASAYRGENLPKESKGWNFASYLERQKQEEGEERKNAEKYWKNRLEHLPKGPDLPLAKTSARSGKNGVQPQDCENRKGRMGSFANAGKKIPDNSGNGSSYCICGGSGTMEQESLFPY